MSHEVKRAYLLEYIDNEKDFEYVEAQRIDPVDPMLKWKAWVIKDHEEILEHAMEGWCRDNQTLQHVKVTKNLESVDGEAIAMYLFYLFRPDIYDVKMMQQTWVDGEIVYDEFIELPSTFIYSLNRLVNEDLNRNYDKVKAQNATLTKANEDYAQFLNKYKLMDAFRKEMM